jgi:hypothetical protein
MFCSIWHRCICLVMFRSINQPVPYPLIFNAIRNSRRKCLFFLFPRSKLQHLGERGKIASRVVLHLYLIWIYCCIFMEEFVPDTNFVFVAWFLPGGDSTWRFICSPMPECEYCMWLIVSLMCVSVLTQASWPRSATKTKKNKKNVLFVIKYSWMSVASHKHINICNVF